MIMTEHDITIGDDVASATIIIAEATSGVGVHMHWDDRAHSLRYSKGDTRIEAIEVLAERWEQLAKELRTLRFRTSCVRDGATLPCLACDECRYHSPNSCKPG